MAGASFFYLAASSGHQLQVWSLAPANPESLSSSTPYPPVSKPVWTFETTPALTCDLMWHPRRCKLATLHSSSKSHIALYSFPGGEHELHYFSEDEAQQRLLGETHPTCSSCLAFPRQVGRFVAVGHSDGRAAVYDLRKELTLRTRIDLPSTSSPAVVPSCIAWAARDRLLVVGVKNSPDLYVCLAASTEDTYPGFTLLPHIPTMDIPCAQQNTTCLTLRTCRLDSTLVAAGYSSGEVIIWQLDWPLSRNPRDHVFFRCHPRHVSAFFHDLLSVTWSPTDTYTLFTSGSPDLNLRLWSVVPASCSCEPLNELVAPEINRGYLTNDVTLDGFLLSTGLMNGRILLYNTRYLSAPICELSGFDGNPVRFLMFAFTNQPHDEVRFVSSLEHNKCVSSRTTDKEDSNLCGEVASYSTEVRGPLRNLSNIEDASVLKSIDGWSDVYRSISLPDSPELSDSDFHRTSLSDKPFAALVVSKPCSIDQPHVPSAGLFVPQSRSTTIPSSQTINACSAGATENCTGSLTKKYLDDFRADIQLSHVNMLYHFSRLEEKVENMFERFSEALVELKKENDELRLQLDRRWYFH
ncbi:hypothetical protein CRM22_010364 [Opisthorchis felineus]|uniref:Uncharacterized protein n=1 Tax=Opisthorchis felineus TaxID=147828 RepID=A0A4S2KZM8_OPIFE|nr:hypothetical protein CRM22_010364 [Opisthorchis felineus]